MVTLIEAVGYLAIALGSHTALPLADMVDRHNERFATAWMQDDPALIALGEPKENTAHLSTIH